MQYLPPTLDVIFKMLLLREQRLLRDMVEAVLGLKKPLRCLTILNPEIPRRCPKDKSITLDVRARLDDGRQLDLEMQASTPKGLRPRLLYYWARIYGRTLPKGRDYTTLRPVVSIVWLTKKLLFTEHFHSIFQLRDVKTRELLCPDIEFHLLELPKLDLAANGADAKLTRWARFFEAHSSRQYDQLAAEDPIMELARNTLRDLSQSPRAQRLAEERRDALGAHYHLLGASYQAGAKKGKAQGRREGRAEGLRLAIATVCQSLELKVPTKRLAQMSTRRLTNLLEKLAREQKWPKGY